VPSIGSAARPSPERPLSSADVAVHRARPRREWRHAPALTAAAVGVGWFALHVGLGIAAPTRVDWLLGGDWAANYLGWDFFRSAPWSLPLGANPLYPYGIGSTVAYSDSLPLLAVLLKPLSPILPEAFQYVGAWLLLAFALQGFVGAKLVALATPSRLAQALGGALFALSPPLLHRLVGPYTGHASLCGHWLLLSSLWIAIAPCADARCARGRLAGACALVLVATGLHPYLAVMCTALAIALAIRLCTVERVAPAAEAAVGVAATLAVAGAGLLAFGYLGRGVDTGAEGFGYFSADLLTLVNPMGWSRAWEGFHVGPGQYEGFGYLGAGGIALLAGAVAALLLRRTARGDGLWWRLVPVAAVSLALAVLALSAVVTLAGKPIALVGSPGQAPWIARTFRSSGRFVLPLHALAVFAAIAALAAALRARPRALGAVLGAAVLLQLADVRPPVPFHPDSGPEPLPSTWELARGAYRHVAMFPPFLVTGSGPAAPEACGDPPYGRDTWAAIAALASHLGATFNGGYLARIDPARAASACTATNRALSRGELDPETVYLVYAPALGEFSAAGATCGAIGGIPVCVRGDRRDAFSEALRRAPLW
jgi:hypothetical protein